MNYKVRKPFAVLTSAALASSLLFGAGAPSASAEDALLKLTFPDVVTSHWARGNIAKLAAVGVIRGYTTGDFRPSQAVTQQEAIVMMLRMMGYYDDELPAADNVAIGFEVDSFFTKFVVKAIEERIIHLGEETAAASSGDIPWGKREATREWIAKLIVRALGQQPATGGIAFADASQISPDAAGYVAKAAELGLVQGITENGQTYYKPRKAVTRAEIVTFLSRADQYIADDAAKYTSGFVASRTATSLQLQTTGGGSASYGLNAETLVFDESGEALTLEDLTTMSAVRVIHSGGQAYYIERTDETIQLETIEGELAALDIAAGTLVLRKADGSLEPYTLAPNASVTNASGAGTSLSQLTEGSELRLQRARGTEAVTAIVLVEAAFNAEGTAVAQAVNATAGTVTFTDASGSVVTYPLAEDAVLTVKGQPLGGGLAGLQIGDTFEYTIKDSRIVELDITVQRFVTATGEFQGYAGNTITIMENSTTPKAYLFARNVAVKIEGLTNTGIEDLQVGDLVQLRISGATNQVDQITVTNRNVTQLKNVTIVQFAAGDYLTVRDEKGKAHLFYVTNRSALVLDGERLSEQLYSTYLAAGRKVSISVSADQLVRLDIITKASGTVTALNTTARTITLRTADDASMTLPYASFVAVEVPLQTSASFADITVGAKVHLSMGIGSDTVNTIQVEKSFVYTFTSATSAPRTVYAKTAQGGTVSLTLDSEARVLDKNGQSIAPTALTAGKPIVVNYVGRKIVSVQEPAAVLGKVSTLDVTGGKLAVTDFNNNVRQYNLSGGIQVQEGTNVSTSASALQLNDRVMVVADAQGKPYLFVAQAEVRKFSSYDAAKNEISFKIAKLTDQGKYTLEPDAYVHTSAGGLLALNRLKENDQVTIYLLNGKIIELVQ